MIPVHVNSNTYIDFNKENNEEGPKFKVGDHVRISKYKSIFAKGYVPNWPPEGFVIKKVKITVPWQMLLVMLKAKKLLERFMKNSCRK